MPSMSTESGSNSSCDALSWSRLLYFFDDFGPGRMKKRLFMIDSAILIFCTFDVGNYINICKLLIVVTAFPPWCLGLYAFFYILLFFHWLMYSRKMVIQNYFL